MKQKFLQEVDYSDQQTIEDITKRIPLLQEQLKQKDLSYEEKLKIEKLLKQKQNYLKGKQ